MLAKIIEWSVRNVFLVLLATLIIIGAGIYAVMKPHWTHCRTYPTCR